MDNVEIKRFQDILYHQGESLSMLFFVFALYGENEADPKGIKSSYKGIIPRKNTNNSIDKNSIKRSFIYESNRNSKKDRRPRTCCHT